MLLLRPTHWAIYIFFIFTQGLTFKQTVSVMLPVYFLQQIGRSVYFVVQHDLDSLSLV